MLSAIPEVDVSLTLSSGADLSEEGLDRLAMCILDVINELGDEVIAHGPAVAVNTTHSSITVGFTLLVDKPEDAHAGVAVIARRLQARTSSEMSERSSHTEVALT